MAVASLAEVSGVRRAMTGAMGSSRSSEQHSLELAPDRQPRRVRCLELLVYANCPLEHRVGLLALIANGLEHACGQRIELALDGGLGP